MIPPTHLSKHKLSTKHIMKQCKNCSKEFESKRATSQFCSAKCRVYFNRKGDSVTNNSVTKDSVTYINKWGKDVRQMDAQTLYAYIGRYEEDTWVGSPEYEELGRRLNTLSLEELKEQGYWIPNGYDK